MLRDHLIRRGFVDRYTRWTKHGELVEDDEVTSRPVHDGLRGQGVEINVENVGLRGQHVEINVENFNTSECTDQVDEMMNELEQDFADIPGIFEGLGKEKDVPLYPGCTSHTKMKAVFKLFNLKAKNGWSDKSFTSLLELLKEMLPEKNELPDSTYKAKKLLCPLSMEFERIPACPRDCVLFRGKYKDLHKCPKCNASRYRPKGDEIESTKGAAAKVAWYLPIIPRFRRLFSNPRDAKLLRWHADCRKDDGMLRHPADCPEWRNIDRTYPDFGSEPRNLRIGLCTDGMNPYGNMSSRHSTWPVLLCIYNLPPWLCMKRRYMMMPLLISGPKQPGNDIDVYLAPLFEDLMKLWEDGVKIFDACLQEEFVLKVMVIFTVNDFPALGNFSGLKTKGEKACPICGEETCSIRLPNYKKNVYLGHRRFLCRSHRYRRKTKEFNGEVDNRRAPIPLTGKEVYAKVDNIVVEFGKKQKEVPIEGIWKKKCIFWDLPYWKDLDVRHCLDGMHIIKNICESLFGLLLNIKGKTKDGINARKDMVEMGIRPELAPRVEGNKTYLPPACYTLSRKEKLSLLECLSSIKVPSGYSSNISRKVSTKEMKLIGMKTHDWHVVLTQLLPVAIRGILPKNVRHSITKLCFFYNSICSKVTHPDSLDQLQTNVVETLCELEMYFPPSFFDIMVHLTIHLVREIKLCGPMFLHWMYPFERAMGQLKGMVRSRSRPEGSIVEGKVTEEVIEYYTDYLESVESIGLPKSRHEGRLKGVGTIGSKIVCVEIERREQAHLKVLQHLAVVSPYVDAHLAELRDLNPSETEVWIHSTHNKTFVRWFRNKVNSQRTENINETIRFLARGPSAQVQTWQGFDMNGFTWYTRKQDGKSTVQNSGVTLEAL
jgi:hypothetical protein